jgi:pulcherriminic acid synthase
MAAVKGEQTVGRNGVVITKRNPRDADSPQYRTYEVYQRERVGESTEKIKPIQLASEDYRIDPYPLVSILRENYPCYRDWLSNSYWITRYNDVTSVFTDDANFETRPRTWYYGLYNFGRDLKNELPVLESEEQRTDESAKRIANRVIDSLAAKGSANLATEFAMRFSLEILIDLLDIPDEDSAAFAKNFWCMQRGVSWDPALNKDGREALSELVRYFTPIVKARQEVPGDDYLSVLANLDRSDGNVTAEDVVVTLLERDYETLHGALANLWFLLMTHPEEFEQARSERRLMKLAYLETLRHSTPVITAYRFAKHEVERFGRLLPEGARLTCSAAAANRDPRIFKDPEQFIVDRRDMCQREPRGQYRADGLATGIAFGLGKPSIHPALPEDRPRSHYAITRDTAVTASVLLAERLGNLRLAGDSTPVLASRTVGEMHTCWNLPVTFKGA